MSGVAVILVALLAKPVLASDLSMCMPTSFDGDVTLRVAYMETTKKDTCELQTPTVNEAKMVEACDKFCATDGKQLSLPLLLGNMAYGFNQAQMADICTVEDGITLDKTELTECRFKRSGLYRIQKQTAKFIAANEVVAAEQLAFQAKMNVEAKRFRDQLVSVEFKEELALTSKRNKPSKIAEKLEEFKAAGALEDTGNEMKKAMEELNTEGEELKKSVEENLAMTLEYFANCNKLFLAHGQENEVLLDICPQGSTECIDGEEGEHVGCCCAQNPIIIPPGTSYRIDGITAVEGGTVDGDESRQLQEEDGTVDVCAEAHQAAKSDTAAARARIDALGQQHIYEAYDAAMTEKYPEYTQHCGSRRLSAIGGERGVDEEGHAEKALPSVSFFEPRPTLHEHAREATIDASPGRQLGAAELAQCASTDSLLFSGLETVLRKGWEATTCEFHKNVEITTDSAADLCSRFCEPFGVPLLLGTTSYGFDLEVVDEIIDMTLKYDEAQLTKCRGYASGFAEIQDKASKFIEELNVFTAAQQLYAASILVAVNEIRAEVQDQEFIDDLKRKSRSKKAAFFKEKVKAGLDKLDQGDEKAKFEAKAALLEAAVNELATTVQASLEGVTKFFAECNDLYLATTEDKEYLLDMCDQGGGDEIDCLEVDGSSHLSCVCTFNPVVFLGMESNSYTTEIMLGANDGRRLSDQSTLKGAYKNVKAVCAESWTQAQPEITAMYGEIKVLGKESQVADHEADMQEAYGDDYCDFPGAPAASSSTSSGASSSGASSSGASSSGASSSTSPDVEESSTPPRNLLLIVFGMMFIHPGLHPY